MTVRHINSMLRRHLFHALKGPE